MVRSVAPAHVLLSQSRKVDEDHQEEQFSIDFVSVVARLRSLGELPEAPSLGRKIHCFMAALADDDLPTAASYKMPISGASADILANIDSQSLIVVIWDGCHLVLHRGGGVGSHHEFHHGGYILGWIGGISPCGPWFSSPPMSAVECFEIIWN